MRASFITGLLTLALLSSGCSVRRMAINKLGNALASGGTTFASDDDPELVKAAVPFSLKLMESLLSEAPDHKGLLLAASSGFTQYAYAFVQQEAEELESQDLAKSMEMRKRARRLYLRGRDYALRGLEANHKGFRNRLMTDPQSAVKALKKKEVPLAYWTAVSWAAAAGIIKNDTDLLSGLPQVEALIDRCLELDESYDSGAIHAFLITFELARPTAAEERIERSRAHFARAVQLSGGQLAGPFVSLAEGVAVEQQDRKEFEKLLHQALEIRPEARPESRLVNLVMQRRAAWLLSQSQNLISDP